MQLFISMIVLINESLHKIGVEWRQCSVCARRRPTSLSITRPLRGGDLTNGGSATQRRGDRARPEYSIVSALRTARNQWPASAHDTTGLHFPFHTSVHFAIVFHAQLPMQLQGGGEWVKSLFKLCR